MKIEVNSQRWLSIEDYPGEIWKDINGYGGFYEVSNIGRVRSKTRITNIQTYCHIIRKPRILKAQYNGNYYRVVISVDGKSRQVLIHRLVAEAFIPNPDNLPQVNHKDENMLNNNVWNLEWCTKQYNMSYGTKPARQSLFMTKSVGRSVTQYSLDGNQIASYISVTAAHKQTNIDISAIIAVCKGTTQRTAGGYLWRYAEDGPPPKLRKGNMRQVSQFSLDGEYVASYESIREATKALGRKSFNNITGNLKGRSKSAYGFIWKYAE